MHRTTVNLDEGIYRRVRALAQRKGRSFARTVEDLLRTALGTDAEHRTPELPLHRGIGPRPGVDLSDRDRLYDLMDGR